MTGHTSNRHAARQGRAVPILVAALTLAACGDVNLNPAGPSSVFPPGGAGIRTLQITGSLTAENGACLEARVLYDGRVLPDSGVVCPDATGCARLDLAATTTSATGRHTLSFQVLRQPSQAAVYVAEVTVRVVRAGLPFEHPISPDPIRVALKAGESADFELNFVN